MPPQTHSVLSSLTWKTDCGMVRVGGLRAPPPPLLTATDPLDALQFTLVYGPCSVCVCVCVVDFLKTLLSLQLSLVISM